jgi:hypothetical protein
MNPAQIELELERLSRRLMEETEAYAEAAERAAQAEADYKRAYFRAYLEAHGTVPEREARAHLAAEEEYAARRITEAVAQAKAELLRTIRAQLDALRTLAASARSVV